MIDKLILNQAELISLKEEDKTMVEVCSNHIKKNFDKKDNFGTYFIGGSYLRGTSVKNISYIDLYFEYKGHKKPKKVIEELNNCLKEYFPDSQVYKDTISIEMKFNNYSFNITPFLSLSETIAIPDSGLNHWELDKNKKFNNQILRLKKINKDYIKLIKILKLWNKNYKINLSSKEIEKMVADLFLNNKNHTNSISDWLWTFFIAYGYEFEANYIYKLRKQNLAENSIKLKWQKFIENR